MKKTKDKIIKELNDYIEHVYYKVDVLTMPRRQKVDLSLCFYGGMIVGIRMMIACGNTKNMDELVAAVKQLATETNETRGDN